MSLTCVIDGVDKSSLAQEENPAPVIRKSIGTPTASITLRHNDPVSGYRVSQGAEMVLSDGAVDHFGGVVRTPSEATRGDLLDIPLEADGFIVYLDYVVITWSQPAGMLGRDAVDYVIANYLTPYGITRDPAMPAGSALPVLNFEDRTAREVLAQVGLLWGGRLPSVDADLVLRMDVPGAVNAPWSITDLAPHIVGEPTVTQYPDGYADAVRLRFGQGTKWIEGEAHEGDGATRVFPLDVTAATAPGSVTVPSGDRLPVGIYGVNDMPWTYRAADNSLYQRSDQTLIAAGQYILTYYTGSFPGTVTSTNGAAKPKWTVLTVPDCFDRTTAQAIADAERAKRNVVKRELKFTTYDDGLLPGQALSVTLSPCQISATYLVTDVEMTPLGPDLYSYTVTCTEGTVYLGGAIDYWKGLGSGSAGTSVSSGGMVVSSGINLAPIPLGGSGRDPLPHTSPAAWAEIPNATHFQLGTTLHQGCVATLEVYVKARNAGISVQVQVYDSAGSPIGSATAAVTSQTWALATVTVPVPASVKHASVKAIPGGANEDIWVAPGLLVLTR